MREVRFPAMGTAVHVLVAGPQSLLATARARIESLESRWSRFLPDSEVSRMNRGETNRIGADTELLLRRCLEGWRRSGGRFDPTVHTAMRAIGYDRTYASVAAGAGPGVPAAPAPGCADIAVGPGHVELPSGVGIDPGGIGKGLAADLVVAELASSGAAGTLVNVGGDLRCWGDPEAVAWVIRLEEPVAAVHERVALVGGALATSTTVGRTWLQQGRARHHLVDPARGLPYGVDAPTLVSVVAGEAWWAEVCTKAVMGTPPALLEGLLVEAAALVVWADGRRLLVNGMEDYLR